MALGAFVLGMMLSGSAFQQRIEAIVGPIKHALLDLFFIAVGMSLDVGLLAERGARMAWGVLGILALKAATLYGLARWYRLGHGGALRMAAMLSQAGSSDSCSSGLQTWRASSIATNSTLPCWGSGYR